MEKIEKIFDKILDVLVFLASLLLLFLLCVVCFEVVSRYFFNAPTTWVVEISSLILLFTPFLVGAWILKRDDHVKMDLVLEMLGPKTKNTLMVITSLLAALACLIILIYGVKLAWTYHITKYYTNTYLRLPKAPLVAIIPFGFLLLFLQSARNMLSRIREQKSPGSPTDKSKSQR